VKNGGKRIRPAILSWFCALNGENSKKALPAMAAVEIFHTWTLMHDDIIDRDITRRGAVTGHIKLAEYAKEHFSALGVNADMFGTSMSLLGGDIQHAWSNHLLGMLAENPAMDLNVVLALLRRLNSYVTPLLISGEAIDVEFEYRDVVETPEVMKMLRLKTAVLLQFCAQAGTCIALNCSDFADERVIAAGEFALNAGMAFQLQDDILGIFSEEETLGKPVGTDLSAGKKTVLFLETLRRVGEGDKKVLLETLGEKVLTNSRLLQIRDIMVSSGALDYLSEKIKDLIAEAKKNLQIFPDNEFKRLLKELADFFIEREV
ncbi:MAG: polyprenyl synthetase family protein, partial [Verrucomicrobiota bacterium]|nr:polyprenyl synthetase family protein [Verrucomicrobiota bacterium]